MLCVGVGVGVPFGSGAFTYDPAQKVLLLQSSSKLTALKDINGNVTNVPFIRNDNNVTHAQEVKIGPQALMIYGGVPTMWVEAVQNTGFVANNGMTAFMKATAPAGRLDGAWTLNPATSLVLAAGDTTTWEYNELSPANVFDDTANNRLIFLCHGGNNNGPRQGGIVFMDKTSNVYTKYASNPVIPNGAAGAFDDHQAGGDLKAVYDQELGYYVGFYRAQKSGGPLTDGSIGRCTSSDLINWTKTGECYAVAPSWNAGGITSGQTFIDAGGRYHMFAPTGGNGIAYITSEDKGVSWTLRTTAGASGLVLDKTQADTGIACLSAGDVVQGLIDGDVGWLTFGAENASTFPVNSPMRGQGMALFPWRKTNPVRKAKYYPPSARTDVTSTALLSLTTFSIMGRFRAYKTQRSGAARVVYFEENSGGGAIGNKQVFVLIDANGGANAGKLNAFYRTPTAFFNLFSTATVDDATWHTFLFRRISTSSAELYVDGVLRSSDAVTNPGTDATATLKAVGNVNTAMTETDSPFKGSISDVATVSGAAWTSAEAIAFINSSQSSRTLGSGGTLLFDSASQGSDSGDVALVEGS